MARDDQDNSKISHFEADATLVRRIEAAAIAVGMEEARAHAHLYPERFAVSMDVAGGCAIYAGAGLPFNKAVAIGLNASVTPDELERLEEFYQSRREPVTIEASPLLAQAELELLAQRGYRTIERLNVLIARPAKALDAETLLVSEVRVREPLQRDAPLWTRTVGEGFDSDLSPQTLEIFMTDFHMSNTRCFLAEIGGQPAGGGCMAIHRGVSLFFGTSTLPRFRRRGVQTALIRERLAAAAAAGCDVASAMTRAGSGSQRNLERQGFRLIYMRSKLLKKSR